jgi:hypothetical protein
MLGVDTFLLSENAVSSIIVLNKFQVVCETVREVVRQKITKHTVEILSN